MSTAGARIAGLLHERHDEIVRQWADAVTYAAKGRLTVAEVQSQVSEMYGALAKLVDSGSRDLQVPEAAELRAVLAELSRSRARRGFSPSETSIAVLALKDAVQSQVDTSDAGLLASFLWFSRLVDEFALFTFETYSRAREELIVEQGEQMMELSTPVIKLWDGVVGVPLVGTLDSARAQVVMEKLLQTLVDTGSAYAIIDITGVPAVDTQVAQHVLKTVMAARLMGAECVISGIRPQIAQTVVSLGIEFGDIVTKASLADALVHTLRRSGIELVRRAQRGEA
ncbi:STAS domain-containing protein [Virgisporangium aliadipatigenens]|nr:STAS domain-containing protein [Virgisporangium aliadipatigenens]